MDKHIIYLEIIFLFSIIVNLIVPGNLFLKILLMLLTFLFYIKEIGSYKLIKAKYNYVGIGFTSILGMFIISQYITHIYFLLVFMCLVVLYLYLFKVLFNITYGVVTKSNSKEVYFKIKDPFFNLNKEFSLKYSRPLKEGTVILIELSKFFVNKKPVKIKKVIK